MPDSVYDVIELVGTSTESWEKAAKSAVDMAAKSLRDLRIARSKSWMRRLKMEKSKRIARK
jgi:flavin-binding protein dodecin